MANGFLDGNQIKTLLVNYKDNVGNLTDAQLIDWTDFLNQFLYRKIASINPDQYLETSVIKPIIGQASYARPTDFKTQGLGGIYFTFSGSDYGALNFKTQTVPFTVGEVITGAISGTQATIIGITQYTSSGTLQTTVPTTSSFEDGEALTGSLGGAAVVNGSLFPFTYSPKVLPITGFGSQQFGFWFDNSNINFTPVPQTLFVVVERYLPRLAEITTLDQNTIIPYPEYKEFARNSAAVYWDQWRQDSLNETFSSARAEAALNDLFDDISTTPDVIDVSSSRNTYRGLRRGAQNSLSYDSWTSWN